MPDLWWALLLVGLFAGVMSGMFGIGGGIVIVPALTILLSFALPKATGTSLTALLLPVGLPAVIAYYRAGKLSIRPALIVAAGLATTSVVGAVVALKLDKASLQHLYGVFVLVMSWRFAEPRKWWAEWRGTTVTHVTLNPDEARPATSVAWYWLFTVGLVAGVLSGLFGIGGGIVIVPALAGLLHMDQKQATGTSLGALLLPVGLPAVVAYYQNGDLDLVVGVLVAVGLLAGALFGARITLGLPNKTIKRLYGVFLLFVALRFLFL